MVVIQRGTSRRLAPAGEIKGFKKFDESNNIIEDVQYFSDGKILNKIYNEYDNLNRKIATRVVLATSDIQQTIEYDKFGNEIEKIGYNSGNTKSYHFKYKYKYDSKGNWTVKVAYNFDKPVSVAERKITYY